jgi:hypothetical protein
LALWALRWAVGRAALESDDAASIRLTATLMERPFGRGLVAAVGVIVLVFGLFEVVSAWRRAFDERLEPILSRAVRRVAVRFARIGTVARGLISALLGFFLVQAAWAARPSRARGMEGALDSLEAAPFGSWVLAGVAVGLVLYGLWQWILAAFRRIEPA